jgi:hypothetical protein
MADGRRKTHKNSFAGGIRYALASKSVLIAGSPVDNSLYNKEIAPVFW